MFFFFQAEDGIRDWSVTGVQTCALPIWFWCRRHQNHKDVGGILPEPRVQRLQVRLQINRPDSLALELHRLEEEQVVIFELVAWRLHWRRLKISGTIAGIAGEDLAVLLVETSRD